MESFFAGEIVTELVKQLGKVVRRVYLCRDTAEQLLATVDQLLPTVRGIQYSGVELPQHQQSQLGELRELLEQGLELARKAASSRRWNVYRSLQLARRMEWVDRQVGRWLERVAPVHALYGGHHIRVDMAERLDRIERKIGEGPALGHPSPAPDPMETMVAELESLALQGQGAGGGVVVDVAAMRVGKEKVKEMVMSEGAGGVVGISGMGGSGKTTLAKEVCRDPDIRRHFNNRIFFKTVSQSPDLERLKRELWAEIANAHVAADAYDLFAPWPLQTATTPNALPAPALVVLDDVWSQLELEELLFRMPGCKTLVVSRFKFPATVLDSTHELDLLGEEEAVRLFCHSAFGEQSIPPSADKELVMQVVAECKGLPLALKVIGASLRDQPPKFWINAKSKLSRGETISESHEAKLLKRMAIGIERLPVKVKECFLDLGSFPEDKKIPLDVLINMWMEIHDLEEEEAYTILVELSNKNLLNLVKDAQNRAGDTYSSYSELSVTQHDVLRDLALYMSNSESANRRQRLLMAKKEKEGGLPREWERGKDLPFEARIVSIHTGEMKESDWLEMWFPKAEALILTFSSGTYFLPPFIGNMPKLKALILINYGSSSAALHNLPVFTSLHTLRSIWFEKITVPPLPDTTVPLHKLKKIFLVLCELNKSLEGFIVDLPRTFPRLSDLTIDHCTDLIRLPSSICEISTLQSLSISNCHELCELPSMLGQLTSLRILRVYACPSMEKLPKSVSQLEGLEYMDISQCIGLRQLPEDLSRLTCLKKVDMRECPLVRSLPRSAAALGSLRKVVCGEEVALSWKEAMRSGELEFGVQVAEECYNMDWFEE